MSNNLCYANEVRFCAFNLIQLNSDERSSKTGTLGKLDLVSTWQLGFILINKVT